MVYLHTLRTDPTLKKKSNLTYYINSKYILRNYIAKLVSRIFSWEQMYSKYQVNMLSVERRRDTTKSSTISDGALINGILFLGKISLCSYCMIVEMHYINTLPLKHSKSKLLTSLTDWRLQGHWL